MTRSSVAATLLMTSEPEDRYVDRCFSPYGTAFLSESIIVQRYVLVQCLLRRVMAVVKARGSALQSTISAPRFQAADRSASWSGRSNRRAASGQLATCHQLSRYSDRRFWCFR